MVHLALSLDLRVGMNKLSFSKTVATCDLPEKSIDVVLVPLLPQNKCSISIPRSSPSEVFL